MAQNQSTDFNIKKWMETSGYQKLRAEMEKEINSHPIVIDYACFRKTPQEKAALATAKLNYKVWLKTQPTEE